MDQKITKKDLAANANAPEALEGSQKMSFDFLEEIGKAGVSKVEFNALVWLACHQDKNGQVLCDVNMMKAGIGISDSYFPGILYKLKDKGLIQFRRTGERRKKKNGMYVVELPYNTFDGDYVAKKYIRLAHGVFRSQKFYDLSVPAKYVILMMVYELRWQNRSDFENQKSIAKKGYRNLLKECAMWGGFSERTVAEGIRKVERIFCGRIRKQYNAETGKTCSILYITFEKEDSRFSCADNYALYTNLLCGVIEEEEGHLFKALKEQGELDHMADLIIRQERMAKQKVEEACKSYKNGVLIQYGRDVLYHGIGGNGESKVINEYFRPLELMVSRTMFLPRKISCSDETEIICRWGFQSAKGMVVNNTSIPLWFRYLAAETVSAFRWLSSLAKYKAIDLEKVDIINTVAEFLNILLQGKAVSFGYMVKRIRLRKA